MKGTIREIVDCTYHEELGLQVIDPSLLLGCEWGDIGRAYRTLLKIEENLVVNEEDKQALKRVINMLTFLM